MLFSISIKNIKKSIKDYSIYFFTLVFAVAMFYTFNSIDAQSSMLELSQSKYNIIKSLIMIINYVSVFVSFVLGFLIIYSNNFLIKRRKKEIGLYLTLGMSKQKVSIILVIETILIGLVSLGIGLILGIVLSQILSVITASLFEIDMSTYKFIFSKAALLKTMLYFGIIFTLVIIFNVITLSKYRLINLLNAQAKNEKIKFRNKYITIITFILSIGCIGYAYYLLFNNALVYLDNTTLIMIIFGSIGTLLLFFSLSGFLVKVFQKNQKIYYNNLNMFVLKQVNNKINTTVISTTVICLMLLLTIGILSGSISMANAFNKDFADNNLTDFTISHELKSYMVNEDNSLSENYKDYNMYQLPQNKEFNQIVKDYSIYTKYKDNNITQKSFMTKKALDDLYKEYGSTVSLNFNVPIMSESDYKSLMNIYNKPSIEIKDNQYLLLSNIDLILKSYKEFYESDYSISIGNYNLTPASDEIIKIAINNYNSNGNDGIVVVSDEIIENLEKIGSVLVGNYKNGNIEEYEKNLYDLTGKQNSYLQLMTKNEMKLSSLGIKTILTFVGLYLGITFAVCSATVLAIGQLSESSDNKDRYYILKQLGASQKDIKNALYTQIAIAFGFPLVIAIIHSIVGLKELNKLIKVIGNIDLTSNIILTSLFIIVLYGGYFLVTCICSKNIIKNE